MLATFSPMFPNKLTLLDSVRFQDAVFEEIKKFPTISAVLLGEIGVGMLLGRRRFIGRSRLIKTRDSRCIGVNFLDPE